MSANLSLSYRAEALEESEPAEAEKVVLSASREGRSG